MDYNGRSGHTVTIPDPMSHDLKWTARSGNRTAYENHPDPGGQEQENSVTSDEVSTGSASIRPEHGHNVTRGFTVEDIIKDPTT